MSKYSNLVLLPNQVPSILEQKRPPSISLSHAYHKRDRSLSPSPYELKKLYDKHLNSQLELQQTPPGTTAVSPIQDIRSVSSIFEKKTWETFISEQEKSQMQDTKPVDQPKKTCSCTIF
jgi:hypothetical protein